MVAQVGALRVTVGADITGLKTGMAQAQREVSRGTRGMQKSVSDLQLTFKEIATTAGRSLRVLGGAFAIGFGAREILNIADAAKNLSAQLRLATAQYGSFAQANKDVQNIAQATRSDLLATAALYSALQRNSDQFGASQQQVARITQTVSEAFKISGASADEASNATRQLVQAFQSGRLQGDEFRSIMENAPRLARALADSLGVTIGQLRTMSKEGTLTAAALVKAFSDAKVTEVIDGEFRQLPVTFDQAIGQIYNAAVITFGEFDSGGQFSNAITNFVTGGTQGFAQLGQAAFDFGADVRGVLDTLDSVKAAFGSLHTAGVGALFGLEKATFNLRAALSGILGVVDGVANAFANLFNAPGNIVRGILGQKLVLNPVNMRGTFDKSVAEADTRRAAANRANSAPGRTPPPVRPQAITGAGGAGRGSSAEALQKRAEREMEERLRQDHAYDQEHRQNQIEILRAEQDVSDDYGERADLSLKILDLERDQELANIDLSVKLKDRSKAEGDALKRQVLNLDALKREAVQREIEQRKAEDAARIADAKFDIRRDQLQSESALATTAAEQRDVQLSILDLAYQQEKAALERVLADKQATEAAKQEAQLRLNALSSRYQTDRAGVVANTRGPMESFLASIPQTAEQAKEAMEALTVQGITGAIDALTELRNGFGAFRDAAIRAIDDVIAQLIRMQLMKLALSLFGGGSGSTSIIPLAGGVMSITDLPGRASGGPVVPGRTYLVGEKGPELFTTDKGGTIIPNHAMGGGSFHFHFTGPMSDRDARRTGMQAAAGFQSEMARSRAKGIS